MAEPLQQDPSLTPSIKGLEVALPAQQYIANVLHKDETLVDDEEIVRPVYEIAGRSITFRNRQETVIVDGSAIHLVAPELTPPVNIGDEHEEQVAKVTEYNRAPHANLEEADLVVVTTTPEGLLAAAVELNPSEETSRLIKIEEELAKGEYGEDAITILDSILAATTVSDGGEYLDYIDTDGYALALAAFSGDTQAQSILENKLASLYGLETRREQNDAEALRENSEKIYQSVETLKPSEVVLVHSTKWPIERDEEGNILLRPAGSLRADRFPRASLHFTVNGEVTSHVFGEWDDSNKLILTNFENALEVNGKPGQMANVDTYYVLNPGQKLKLPGAVVVQGGETLNLIQDEGDTVTYKRVSEYSADEIVQIRELAMQLGISNLDEKPALLLREVALRQAMKRLGAEWYVKPGPHYIDDTKFQEAYSKLANELGVTSALHDNTGDGHLEREVGLGMVEAYIKKAPADRISAYYVHASASLAARRMVVANGYVPARPFSKIGTTTDPNVDW